VGFLVCLLGLYVEYHHFGKVMLGPFEMSIRDGRSRRTPDMLFVKPEHEYRFDSQRLNGPADLVIEIVSDDSARRDHVEKLADYAIGGVPEYWIIDPRPTGRPSEGFN
jgi:Uma2 family endonuclease